jgi:hypothetical protein
MLKKIASTPKKVAAHVRRRRARYAAAIGFIAGGATMRALDNDIREDALTFIEEKGLSNEFWNPEN